MFKFRHLNLIKFNSFKNIISMIALVLFIASITTMIYAVKNFIEINNQKELNAEKSVGGK
ncbi:hypothetical protein EF513_02650 [Rickettsiales endosymbiont of Stachyamoeba lipophora]|nr:hypothetical protein EF513_02650 [Rickettsiales endosymbiont of Stachyamoeba lipophora]